MTTQTHVLPELDEALDFEPVCEFPGGCKNAAVWFGTVTPCGCATILACEPCRRDEDEDVATAPDPSCIRCWSSARFTWRPL